MDFFLICSMSTNYDLIHCLYVFLFVTNEVRFSCECTYSWYSNNRSVLFIDFIVILLISCPFVI